MLWGPAPLHLAQVHAPALQLDLRRQHRRRARGQCLGLGGVRRCKLLLPKDEGPHRVPLRRQLVLAPQADDTTDYNPALAWPHPPCAQLAGLGSAAWRVSPCANREPW